MWDKEKVELNILNNIDNNYNFNLYNYNFIINEKPESYARERAGRGNHFYNPKTPKIEKFKKIMLKQLSKEQKEEIQNIIKNTESYYVNMSCDFYIPIPKNDSLKIAIKKESKEILPGKRPDLDNYTKLLLDAMHDVVYHDDSKVVSITANKFYSTEPRTEIKITIKEIKEN